MVLVVAVVVLVAVVVVVAVARTAAAAVVLVAAEAHRDRRGLMADECLRSRGRRTGAGAVAAVYSGDQRQATPPFPSVCRLVEKYTLLIERHRQNQQNGLTAPVRGGKSSKPASSKSAVPSGPAIGEDDAAAWNRLLMDNGGGENENDDDVNGNGDDGYDDDDDDGGGCDRRFSCVSLGSIQAGTCTRDFCNRRRRSCCRLAVTAAAVVMVVGRGGDKLPVTTCSRLSALARGRACITQRRPMCLGRRTFHFLPLSVSSISVRNRIAHDVFYSARYYYYTLNTWPEMLWNRSSSTMGSH